MWVGLILCQDGRNIGLVWSGLPLKNRFLFGLIIVKVWNLANRRVYLKNLGLGNPPLTIRPTFHPNIKIHNQPTFSTV